MQSLRSRKAAGSSLICNQLSVELAAAKDEIEPEFAGGQKLKVLPFGIPNVTQSFANTSMESN